MTQRQTFDRHALLVTTAEAVASSAGAEPLDFGTRLVGVNSRDEFALPPGWHPIDDDIAGADGTVFLAANANPADRGRASSEVITGYSFEDMPPDLAQHRHNALANLDAVAITDRVVPTQSERGVGLWWSTQGSYQRDGSWWSAITSVVVLTPTAHRPGYYLEHSVTSTDQLRGVMRPDIQFLAQQFAIAIAQPQFSDHPVAD